MFLYSVFQPAISGEGALERAVFVRQGFDRLAFSLTPVWAIRHGLWLMLTLWLLWMALIFALTTTLHLDEAAAIAVYALGALAFGLEADRAREAKLARNGMIIQGLSMGANESDAETVYLGRLDGAVRAPMPQVPPSPPPRSAPVIVDSDVLGLFPGQEQKP